MGQCWVLPPPPSAQEQPSTHVSHVSTDVLYIDPDPARCHQCVVHFHANAVSVACCTHGVHALAWLNNDTLAKVSLVIIHQHIADMPMAALASRIHEIHPTMPVVGIFDQMSDQLLTACMRANITELFQESRMPNPLLLAIVHIIHLQRDSTTTQAHRLSFHPDHVHL